MSNESKKQLFLKGLSDGLPIGIGYFAVSFSLGIAAERIGMSAFQGFLLSLTCIASAGEYAAITLMSASASILEMIGMMIIANARYLLMSTALNQRFSDKATLFDRISVSAFTTDELFAIAIARPGDIKPVYSYGAIAVAIPLWALGTFFGVIAGNILPEIIVAGLSVAIFGMFLAIIIPPTKKDKAVLVCVIVSFIWSYITSLLVKRFNLPSGIVLLISTVLIAGIAAIVKPVENNEN